MLGANAESYRLKLRLKLSSADIIIIINEIWIHEGGTDDYKINGYYYYIRY